MFDRFTDRARKVMGLARQEALRRNHDYLDPMHVLLGAVQEGSGVGASVLKNLGVDLGTVRDEVERLARPGPHPVPAGQIPFTPGAKKLLEHTLDEAIRLGHTYIGTEHLLLGLVRDDGAAGKVLADMGLKLEAVRDEVLEVLGSEPDEDVSPLTPSGGRPLNRLLAAFRARPDLMAATLEALNVSETKFVEALHEELEASRPPRSARTFVRLGALNGLAYVLEDVAALLRVLAAVNVSVDALAEALVRAADSGDARKG